MRRTLDDSLPTHKGWGPEQLFFSSEQLHLTVILSPCFGCHSHADKLRTAPHQHGQGRVPPPVAPSAALPGEPGTRDGGHSDHCRRLTWLPASCALLCSQMMEGGLWPLLHRLREGGDGQAVSLAHWTCLSAVLGYSSVALFENYILKDSKAFFVLAGLVFDHTFNDSKQPLPLKVRDIPSRNGLTMFPSLGLEPIRESWHPSCPSSLCPLCHLAAV